jgi:hypothetical protein
MRFDPNISSLDERECLGKLSMDELHFIFTSCEMREKQENISRKEVVFKKSKKTKKKYKNKSKSNFSSNDD